MSRMPAKYRKRQRSDRFHASEQVLELAYDRLRVATTAGGEAAGERPTLVVSIRYSRKRDRSGDALFAS